MHTEGAELSEIMILLNCVIDSPIYSVGSEDLVTTVGRTLAKLVEPEYWTWVGSNSLAIGLLSCIERMVSAESPQENLTAEQRLSLLTGCERVTQTLRLMGVPQHATRTLRFSVSQMWQEKCAVAANQRGYVVS